MNPEQREIKSNLVVNLGLISNIFLSVIKTFAGIVGGSTALIADGINSISDIVYYVVVKIFIKLAKEPADHEHPYGHSQMESIAALIVGAFVITTSIVIFWNSVDRAYKYYIGEIEFTGASVFAFSIAVFTILLKLILTIYTKNVGNKTKNPAIIALAYDHRNDVFSSLAVAIGVYWGIIGYGWVDPLAGAIVALVILKTGIEIIRTTSFELMDAVPSILLSNQIKELISKHSEIKQIEEIHAHRFGPYLVINITICIDGNMSVKRGDEISTEVENIIYDNLELVRRVYVHYHPMSSEKNMILLVD